MKRISRVVILITCLTLLLPGIIGNKSSLNPSGAIDEVTLFEIQAGMIGRSELYALEQLRLTQLNPNRVEPAMEADSVDLGVTGTLTYTAYLPLNASTILMPMIERRGLWITRYDWTSYGLTPAPDDVSAMVNNVSRAGFNTVFFQIRAAGDSFYTPGLEPWSARLTTGPVSETLGVDPGWDPLAVMLQTAHSAGIEVHAYFNVYTAWLPPPEGQGELGPPATTPPQMFDLFTYGPLYSAHPGLYALGYMWRQYVYPDTPMPLVRNQYLWASPGVDQVQDHIASVAADILSRYDVDGMHLDLVRYAGPGYSYDPHSNAAAGPEQTAARDQWQRNRITALVSRISTQAHALHPGILVSAAVWPVYVNKWGFVGNEGYSDYFQDSKGWLQTGAVDAIAPMLYGSIADDFENWQILMEDFVTTPSSGDVYPGIGVYTDFSFIENRITAARTAGTVGHVIFSYGGLNQMDYWDDLANGPYRRPAILPSP